MARTLQLTGIESVDTLRALASETRMQILTLLTTKDMNINELVHALGITQPSVTKHVQVLEDAGLITSDYLPGTQGMQKRCRKSFDRFVVEMEGTPISTLLTEDTSMPIGLYTAVDPKPTCGLASPKGYVGVFDDPVAFHFPERAEAQILWMADGYVEYYFPNTIPLTSDITGLELLMEICSETPGYDNSFPSDLMVWVNGVELGSWRSPGDFGGRRGRLNPQWWPPQFTQYGLLKAWSVDNKGSYVDGISISQTKVKELGLAPWKPTTVRIGVKPDAEFRGGFTLFGKGFGNYEHDLVLRLRHTPRELVGHSR